MVPPAEERLQADHRLQREQRPSVEATPEVDQPGLVLSSGQPGAVEGPGGRADDEVRADAILGQGERHAGLHRAEARPSRQHIRHASHVSPTRRRTSTLPTPPSCLAPFASERAWHLSFRNVSGTLRPTTCLAPFMPERAWHLSSQNVPGTFQGKRGLAPFTRCGGVAAEGVRFGDRRRRSCRRRRSGPGGAVHPARAAPTAPTAAAAPDPAGRPRSGRRHPATQRR